MKKIVAIALSNLLVGSLVFAAGAGETQVAAPTFKGKNVRVVIGSTATSGDSYLISASLAWAFYDEHRTKKRARLAKGKDQ